MTNDSAPLAQEIGVTGRQPSALLRRATALLAIVMVMIGLLLLYLLAKATNNREMYEENYAQLFTINLVVAGAPGAIWQPSVIENRHYFCLGGRGARTADLCGVLPVCFAFHRNLV